MTNQRRTAELIDRYFDALAHDPDAPPPPGLDPESAGIVRAVVAEQRRAEGDPVLEQAPARVWERVVGGAALTPWPPLPILGEGEPLTERAWLKRAADHRKLKARSGQIHPSHSIGRGAGGEGLSPRRVRFLVPVAAIAAVLVLANVLRPQSHVPIVDRETQQLPLPDAAAQVARAQVALISPASVGLSGLLVTELTVIAEPGGGETRTRTERVFQAPDRWRVESDGAVMSAAGVVLLPRTSLAISDGTEVLTYSSGDPAAVVSPYLYWSTRALLGTLTAVPGQPRTNPPSDLTLVLQQAGACYTPALLYREPVAGHSAAVVDLGTSRCTGATAAAFAGRWTLWIDEESGLVLRATQQVDGSVRVHAEVEQIVLDPAIDAERFRLQPPAGVPLSYPRPPPLPRPESSPSGN